MSPKTVGVLIFRPGKAEPEQGKIVLPQSWSYGELNEEIKPLIGEGVKFIEHVSVLFKDAQADMFVDEYGAMTYRGRPALPVNEAATAIYHAASKGRGDDMTGAAKIDGVAVITETRIWF